jgi:hypothetical protein
MRRVASGKKGSACRRRPSRKITVARRSTRRARPGSSRSMPGPSASGIETPTTKRKNGKTMSVGVHPCHSACRSGG